MSLETVNGYVDHIIYHNADNAYTVMSFIVHGEELTVVGTFPGISEGENLEIQGEYTTHATYGEQLKAKSYAIKEPEDADAMQRYLGSGAVKGVGPALAKRIVKKFKGDTFRVMEEEPERLAEVKGISKRMAMEISDQMVEKRDVRDAMVFLEKYGIHSTLAVKVYNQYGPELYNVIRNNPYKMAEDISGVGFRIADEIASRVGISTDSEYRIRCGVLYVLNQAAGNGHTYLPRHTLVEYAANILNVPQADIDSNLMNMAMEKKIVIKQSEAPKKQRQMPSLEELDANPPRNMYEMEQDANPIPPRPDQSDQASTLGDHADEQIYASIYYRMEEMSAAMLVALNEHYEVPESLLETAIARIQREEDMQLDDRQKEAVFNAARNGVFLLTGGPGTGKTTTIRAMIQYFLNEGDNIMLAAPTGRAAKRMSEATGFEAKTIHRLLEVNGGVVDDDENRDNLNDRTGGMFERNQFNPLEADVIIIDEVSMVDISLIYNLLKAVADKTRLILVGDVNQLPSVGPGNVLKDLISSKRFATVVLEKIFRQASQSDIVVNAHKIHNGEPVTLDNKSKDFFFLKRYDADRIISVTLQLIRDKLPGYVNASTYDIQVLTPTRKGLLGVERLNTILQQYLNPTAPGKKEYTAGERIFREGDKVMQIKNNYQLEWEVRSKYGLAIDKGTGVFNGDTGIVDEINTFANTLTVRYDENRMVEYPLKQLDELELAYAITIHKSQGSEYPAVVIPLLPGPKMLLNRNLLYTAVTRAKKCVTLVGDDQVFTQMCNNNTQARRYSGLEQRLLEA